MYNIITTPNKLLLEKAKPVSRFDKKLKDILKNMSETLNFTTDPIGVGLAAPQVGLSLRIFQMKPTENSKIESFINPIIESTSEAEKIPQFANSAKIESKKPNSSKNKLLEGCLSIPNIWGNVSRKKTVKLRWQDETGSTYMKEFSGFPAIIIQHETDHLNGILFTKHAIEQGEKLFKSHKNKNGEDKFDELKI